jgi:uncharacterized protein YegL
MSDLPGGAISNRPLRFFWVLDVSGSMAGSKIDALNYAVREALPAMRDAADDNANAAVEVRAMTFGSGFNWVNPAPIALEQFTWQNVYVNGITDMGAAMKALAAELTVANMPARALPPVIVLVSDGQPTDDFDNGLAALMAEPWGRKAVRIAIAIGDDADLDVLRRFIGHAEVEPLTANNPEDLVNYIRWVSTEVLKATSAPASQAPDTSQVAPTPMDNLPQPPPSADAGDVW